jgi:hypothetical protein
MRLLLQLEHHVDGELRNPDRHQHRFSPRLHGRPEKTMDADPEEETLRDPMPYLEGWRWSSSTLRPAPSTGAPQQEEEQAADDRSMPKPSA